MIFTGSRNGRSQPQTIEIETNRKKREAVEAKSSPEKKKSVGRAPDIDSTLLIRGGNGEGIRRLEERRDWYRRQRWKSI